MTLSFKSQAHGLAISVATTYIRDLLYATLVGGYDGLTQLDELRDGLLLPEGRVAALGEKHHQHIQERLHGEALGLVRVDRAFEEQSLEAPEPVDAVFPAAPGVLGPRGVIDHPVGRRTVHSMFVIQLEALFLTKL